MADPKEYNKYQSVEQAEYLVWDWLTNSPDRRRQYFGVHDSLTQDVMDDPGMTEARAAWAAAGYPEHFTYYHRNDKRNASLESIGGGALSYARENAELYLSVELLGSSKPEGPVDAVGGVLGSLDRIDFDYAGPGKVRVTVQNDMNWESGSRIPGTDISISGILRSSLPDFSRPGWAGSSTHTQIFRWIESY